MHSNVGEMHHVEVYHLLIRYQGFVVVDKQVIEMKMHKNRLELVQAAAVSRYI